MRSKYLLSLAAAIPLSAGALAYALWGVDFVRLGHVLGDMRWWVLAPFLAVLAVHLWSNALRWAWILRPLGRFRTGQVFPAMMVGIGGNNVLPAHLGEFARAIVFARRFGIPASAVLTTQVVERIFDVLAILFFYVLAAMTVEPFPETIRVGSLTVGALLVVLCAVLLVLLWLPQHVVRLWEWAFAWLPAALYRYGAGLLSNVLRGFSGLRSPQALIWIAGTSLAKWISCGGLVWWSLYAVHTVISLHVSMLVIAVLALAVTLPAAPGFVGTIQAAFVVALVPFGVTQEAALAASLIFMLVQWILTTAAGAWGLAWNGLNWRDVRTKAETLSEQGLASAASPSDAG